MNCPVCGSPTATMPNPVGFLTGRPALRHCTNPGDPARMWDACTWERTEP